MAFGAVTLLPGVNVERTPTTLRTGYSQSSLIRYKDSLAQKLGGWAKYYLYTLPGVPRDLHAWQDLDQVDQLAVGTTTSLTVISDGTATSITPQTLTSNFAPNISTTNGSPTVSITDPNVTNVTTFDSIFFNVPVSQGGIILDGLYPISLITGAHSYEITAASNATATTTNPTATNAVSLTGSAILNFAGTPAWVTDGMVAANLTVPGSIAANTVVTAVGANTATISPVVVAPGVGSGDNIVFSSVPVFTTASGSAVVNVAFIAHGLSVGDAFVFPISTTGSGVTILGTYAVASVVDVDHFTIIANSVASGTTTFAMNDGKVQLVYYITLGPLPAAAGYGLGGYGLGGYGTGAATPSQQIGTAITATDWTMDNWGELLLACPAGGGIYYWNPDGGFPTASLVSTGPIYNSGIFVSTSQQIVVAYGSSVEEVNDGGVGVRQDPMLVRWCDSGNFFDWMDSVNNQAGSFRIPIGSEIRCGAATPNQNLLWTDLDLWAMNYIGYPEVFGFNKIGAGAGAVGRHAVQQLRGGVYWMGATNFYAYTGSGVAVLPCPVWDAVFQNLNTAFLQNVRAMPNTPFNEVGWFYPSTASVSGENDSYVKMNITEPGAPWDYGLLARSAWIDQTALGMPIATTPQGIVYQHETTLNADDTALAASFTTGYFYIAEGEEFAFVDQILPDMKWGLYGQSQGAQVLLTFYVTDYPGGTIRTHGPYTMTSATEYLSTRMRGRLMAIGVSSTDLNSFWRLGSIKYRFSIQGRR